MNQVKLLFLAILALLLINGSLHADYKDRMKERLPKVVAAKKAGSVGEGVDGFLHVRSSSDESIKKLVSDENADRKQYIAETAKKLGSSIQEVSHNLGKAMRAKDIKGYWQKDRSGNWSQK